MSEHKTGNVAHDNSVIAAELVRQNAMRAAGLTQAAARAADRAYLSAVIASGKATGVSVTNTILALDALNRRRAEAQRDEAVVGGRRATTLQMPECYSSRFLPGNR